MLIGILADYFKGKGADLEKCKGSVNYDPFKKPLVKGKENENWVEAAAAVLKAGVALPGYKVLAVNAFYFNNAGAYISQELGYALAWGNELLAKLAEAGLDVTEVAKKIKIHSPVSVPTTSRKSPSSVPLVGCGLKSLPLTIRFASALARLHTAADFGMEHDGL